MNMALRNKFVQQYADNYVSTAVTEATPHKLVGMLYDGALKNLKLAKVFVEQNQLEKKSRHINKALSIINSLKSGVDLEVGGEIAGNLFDLYDYCYRRTFEASTKNNVDMISEVIDLISGLNESWNMMPENIKSATKDQIERIQA